MKQAEDATEEQVNAAIKREFIGVFQKSIPELESLRNTFDDVAVGRKAADAEFLDLNIEAENKTIPAIKQQINNFRGLANAWEANPNAKATGKGKHATVAE